MGKNDQQKPRRSSLAAGLLGIFLGQFGIHDFYLGYKKQGKIHLLMTFGGWAVSIAMSIVVLVIEVSQDVDLNLKVARIGLAWAVLIGYVMTFASWVWGFAEGILCLLKKGKYGRDADGQKLI